ncbi:MAG: hypothetical protein ACOWWR_15545 [Eubacteriales bacterium]
MKKKILFFCCLIIFLILAIILKSCSFSSLTQEEKSNTENIVEDEMTKRILKSSDAYMIGKWSIHYKDIVHYVHDDKGMPEYDLYEQPGSLFFNLMGKGLVLEEEYAVTSAEYNDTNFILEIDLRIAFLEIDGNIVDENSWEGELLYYGSGNKLLSKCKLVAIRDVE